MTAQDVRFFQTFTYVLAGLVGFTIFIYILASVVADKTQRDWRTDDPDKIAAIDERMSPVGRVTVKGEEQVTLTPSASTRLAFLDEPPAAADHGGEESHGGDGGSAGDESMAAGTGADEAEASVAESGESSSDAAQGGGDTAASSDDGDAESGDMVAEADADADAQSADEAAGGDDGESGDGGESMSAAATADLSGIDGAAIYNQGCNACHAIGAAGAPKLGDESAWEPRIAKGKDTLYQHAINGFNAMPAKGGFAYLSDEEVMAAVNYMVDQL